jgi:hypothetical protein
MAEGDGRAPDFSIEVAGPAPVCGIDEVGRGPWAGPVVAAAVILDRDAIPAGLDDSKRLTALRREALLVELEATAVIGIGQASVAEITTMNILQASFLAMRRAVAALPQRPALALVDGVDAGVVGAVELALELEVVGWVGEDQVDRGRGQRPHDLDAVAGEDRVERQRLGARVGLVDPLKSRHRTLSSEHAPTMIQKRFAVKEIIESDT